MIPLLAGWGLESKVKTSDRAETGIDNGAVPAASAGGQVPVFWWSSAVRVVW